MAYEITNKAYLCRTIRSTKLYARPNDIKSTNSIIPGDITITTSNVCDNGIVKFLKISDVLTGENKEWVGLWISDDEVEKTEILQEEETPQETQFDDSVAIDEQLVIKASNTTITGIGDISKLLETSIKIIGNNNGLGGKNGKRFQNVLYR